MDCSPPGSSLHGIFQARVLEWVAISFSKGSSQPRDRTQVSHIARRFFTIWATRKPYACINRYPVCPWGWGVIPVIHKVLKQELPKVKRHKIYIVPYPLLLLLLSCFIRVRLCASPQTEAHQAPPSLGFSRQEHWSGLPFPSPVPYPQ